MVKMYRFGKFERLRFGDIIQGYPSIIPTIEGPFLKDFSNHIINYDVQNYLVIIDPCCAIGELDKTLSLTLLSEIDSNILDNPFLAEDITRINEIQKPLNCIHPTTWNNSEEDNKRIWMDGPSAYPYNNYFIYDPIPELKSYDKHRRKYIMKIDDKTQLPKFERDKDKSKITISHYMIDFKKIFHIYCGKIRKQNKPIDEEILSSKIAELMPKAREKLREKVADYFGKPAEEDIPYL